MDEKDKKNNKEKSENGNKNNIYINNVKNRLLILSPTVEAGIERECTKEDFYSEGSKEIGKGGYSHVWKVSHKNTGKIYVIKLMSKQRILKENLVEQINREVKIMYKVNHPHIIKLINHFEDDQNVYLIMELGAKGHLLSFLKKFSHGLDQMVTAQYMREIISAIKYLHSMDPPVIHRDIKPENILLDSNGRCKLADFGLATYINDNKRVTFCGTPQYLAPEMVERKGHGLEIDIWALGVLCFELLTGKLPFNGKNEQELYGNIKSLNINWQGDDFNPLAKNLITKILKYDPKDRPSLDEILAQPWFESYPLSIPLLEEKKIVSNEEFLEEHTISLQKKEDGNEKKIIPKKKTTITDVVKQINSDTESNIQKNVKNSKDPELTNNNTNQINNEEKEKINNKNEEINKALNEKIDSLNKIIDSQKNLINEMKQKNDKYELELDKLKKELSSIKEQQKTIVELNDKIKELKANEEKRIHLLAEVEEKNYTIVNLNSKLKEKEEDIKRFEKVDENSKEELKKNKKLLATLEKTILDLKTKLKEMEQSNQKALAEKEKQNLIYKQKLVEESLASDKVNKANIIFIINDSIKELGNLLDNKSEKISKILNDIENTVTNSLKKPDELIENMNKELKDLTQSTEKSLEDVNKNSMVIIENEIKSKLKLQFDWQNKQIDELMEYKIKAKNLEIKINSLETKNKSLEDMAQIIKDQNDNLDKLLKEKEEKMKQIEIRLIDTENFNAYLKDFIFRGRNIDEYEEYVENHIK